MAENSESNQEKLEKFDYLEATHLFDTIYQGTFCNNSCGRENLPLLKKHRSCLHGEVDEC